MFVSNSILRDKEQHFGFNTKKKC